MLGATMSTASEARLKNPRTQLIRRETPVPHCGSAGTKIQRVAIVSERQIKFRETWLIEN